MQDLQNKFLEDYVPFEEDSIEESVHKQISLKFREKQTHKQKCDKIRIKNFNTSQKLFTLRNKQYAETTVENTNSVINTPLTTRRNLGGGFHTAFTEKQHFIHKVSQFLLIFI